MNTWDSVNSLLKQQNSISIMHTSYVECFSIQNKLLDAIIRVHQVDCTEQDGIKVFEVMLSILLDVTQSSYALIGSTIPSTRKTTCLQVHEGTSNSSKIDSHELVLSDANTLLGDVVTNGRLLLVNDLKSDCRPLGLPTTQSKITSFLAVPLHTGKQLLGLVLVANRKGGFTNRLADDIESFTRTVAQVIHGRNERHKRLEAELKLSSVVQAMQECILCISEDGFVTSMNASACEFFGQGQSSPNPSELSEGIPYSSPFTPFDLHLHELLDSLDGSKDFMENGLDGFTGRPRRAIGKKHSGTLVPLEVSLSKGFHIKEQFYVAIVRDISEKLEAEAKLKESEERWLYALSGSDDGVWDWNMGDNTLLFSESWYKMLGYEKTDLEYNFRDWEKLAHPDDKQMVLILVQQHVEGKTSKFTCEYRMKCKDGSYRWVLARGKIISRAPDGSPIRFVGTNVDITQRKADEIALISAKEAAERASQVKADFLATMSHEIRTPLNGVIGMTSVLMDSASELSEEQMQQLTAIRDSGDVLLHIINDILDYSKIESGKLEMERTTFNIIQAVERVADMLIQQAESKGLELIIEVKEGTPACIVGDAGRTLQVLINLVSNAIKFTDNGYVLIQVAMAEEGVKTEGMRMDLEERQLSLRVIDTGIGIPEEKHSRIFCTFSQVDASTTRRFGGTGLGLAISKQLVELMGGTIAFSSQHRQGATFTVTLPTGYSQGRNGEEKSLENDVELEFNGESLWQDPLTVSPAVQNARVLFISSVKVTNQVMATHLRGIGMAHCILECDTVQLFSHLEKKQHANNLQSLSSGLDFMEESTLHLQESCERVLKEDWQVVIFDFSHTLSFDKHKVYLGLLALKSLAGPGVVLLVKRIHRQSADFRDITKFKGLSNHPPIVLSKPIIRPKALYRAVEDALQVALCNEADKKCGFPKVKAARLLRQSSAVTRQLRDKKLKEMRASSDSSLGLRVLLVEDNHINQIVAQSLLKSLGCQVEVANNGLEAVAAFQRTDPAQFDIILMDCQMPVMDGWAATRHIRELQNKRSKVEKHIPIVALTANALKGDREKCLEAGMTDYLSKPVRKEFLENMLNKYICRPSNGIEGRSWQQTDGTYV